MAPRAESRKPRRSVPVALLLAGLALVAALLMSVTDRHTAGRIADNERAWRLRGLHELVPPERYDNAMFDDTISVVDPELLGTQDPVTVYRAFADGRPVAAILTPVASGYAGAIELLVAIAPDGRLVGVRVRAHQETPGLGDAIADPAWLRQFEGLSLQAQPAAAWAVQRDGGRFDQLTGATISPRAVVNAVRDALRYFQAHRERLFRPAAGVPLGVAGP